jgi:SAM-dependent methyltransferase
VPLQASAHGYVEHHHSHFDCVCSSFSLHTLLSDLDMSRFDMKTDWDVRAGEDAHKAIACDDAQNESAFRASGERDLQLILQGVSGILKERQSVLEIGCGTGRLLEPLTRHFDQVFGVDVSGEMVRRGRERLAHLPEVHFLEIDGLGKLPFEDKSFNFCFSYITFHHIPIKSVVRSYINESQRVLKMGGVARWHFFGRPAGILASIRESVTHKDTWRGCKFTLGEITASIRAAGFQIVDSNYVAAKSWRLFGKTPPDVIWITARKPDGQARLDLSVSN